MSQTETLQLSHGPLQFTAYSQGTGPVVLLLHGFPDNAHTWRAQLPVLAQAGYRAVALTMRGYEPSSQPADEDYSQATLATDVVAALDALKVEQAHLVGHDWGAAVGYYAAALAPTRIRSLTTMAVPHPGRFLADIIGHPRQLGLSWYMLFFQLRGIAEWQAARNDFAFIRWLWQQWSPNWGFGANEFDTVLETFRQPGVLKASLTYYRNALRPSAIPITPTQRVAARFTVPVPTLALTGAHDRCIDPEVFRALMVAHDFPAGMRVQKIANAGHFLHQEQADAVNHLLLDWLAQHPA